MQNAETIKQTFLKHRMKISQKQAEKFEKYYQFLIEENKKFNLTAITEFEDVVLKHFIDSAVAVGKFKGKVLDVGSGAGFPGIVLAILRDDIQITLLDSLNKRVNFLNSLIELLELKNVKAVHARIEDFEEKQAFDCVTARAVANMQTLSEYLLPFVKIGGKAIIYKGADFFEELENAQNAIKTLGGQLEEIERYNLNDMMRAIIVLRKVGSAPAKFPRGGNLPRKNPL